MDHQRLGKCQVIRIKKQSKAVRVLEVCTSESLGGLELYFLKCCEKLCISKDVEVMAFLKDQSQIQKGLDSKVKSWDMDLKSIINKVQSLNRCISSFQPDIIHSHIKTDLLAIAICKLFNKENFVHVHTRQMNMPRKKRDFFHSFIYGKIDLLITITKRLREQVLENINIDPKKVRVLYYGVPEAGMKKPNPFERVGKSSFKVGVVARIDRKKQQHIVLEAASLLKNSDVRFDVLFVGSVSHPDYEAYLKERIHMLGLQDQVFLTGFMDHPQSFMPYFDVVILTTGNETFGLVLAEAMRMGVAVIGASGGGVPEIIDHGETGLLFEPENPKSLSIEIVKLINNRNLAKQLAQKGKEKADKLFNIESHFCELEKIFLKLIGN